MTPLRQLGLADPPDGSKVQAAWSNSSSRPASSPAPKEAYGHTLRLVLAIGVVAFIVANLVTTSFAPVLHNRMLPWVLGRGLGLAAYLDLTALVVLGIWVKHPWSRRWPVLHPAARLRAHAALGIAAIGLVAAHVLALLFDPFAKVGWLAVVAPGMAGYRPWAVALGTVALYGCVAVVVSALLAGSLASRVWLDVHRLAVWSFAIVWFHGVLSGTDTPALVGLYTLTGILVLVLGVSHRLAGPGLRRSKDAAT